MSFSCPATGLLVTLTIVTRRRCLHPLWLLSAAIQRMKLRQGPLHARSRARLLISSRTPECAAHPLAHVESGQV